MEKVKVMIIAPINAYVYIWENYWNIYNYIKFSTGLENFEIIAPYQLKDHENLNSIIAEKAKYFLIQSNTFVNNLKLKTNNSKLEKHSNFENYVRIKQSELAISDLLQEKLKYFKENIDECSFYIIINPYEENENELKKEIKALNEIEKLENWEKIIKTREIEEFRTEIKIAEGKNKKEIKVTKKEKTDKKILQKQKA